MADLLKQSEQTNILQTCLFGATDPSLFGATDTTPKTTKDMAALSPKSKEIRYVLHSGFPVAIIRFCPATEIVITVT